MDIKFKNAFEYKVIYVFTIKDNAHEGFVKIGDATIYTDSQVDLLYPNCRELNQAALRRIKSYTNTAGIKPILLHTEIAVKTVKNNDGTVILKAFRDYEVHKVLKNSGINNTEIGDSTGREWFKIDLETATKAINAVKNDYSNLSNSGESKFTPIIFRPEQEEAISKTVKQFKKSDRMLWNAKMRFGKTVCALEVIKRMKFKKSIIITHRPVVNAGWYEDFTKIFLKEKDYIYGSKLNGYSVEKLMKSNNKFVYFASIQDLRGSTSVGGKFNKNKIIFDTVWDCVIIDEAHEGTTTALGDETVKSIVKEGKGTKFLALSGTPFNILTNFDENSIYTWDYIMEQESKSEWDKFSFGDSNPYEELPELKIYTYSLENILANKNYIAFEDKSFNFQEFFRTWTGDFMTDYASMPESAHEGDFVHESDIWSFLNLMTKEDKSSCYPFANEEYRSLFKHSLWMVPGVKEAKALKRLMLKHPVFGNGMFDIVNVAGNGDEEEKTEEALKKVLNAIKRAGNENYTITLSCGKLTTGVTVREWTAVFMLAGSYSTSAANYLQTIFRVQSPCNKNGKIKETSYVFDFAPDRTLKMVSSAVSVSSKAGKTKLADKQIMGKFLNYCPVISVSGSEMKEYTTQKLLQQLKKAYAEKVVRNGFDDKNLYSDELLKLQEVDILKFDELKGMIGSSKRLNHSNDITVNDQGLTNEEYEEVEKLKKKKKKDLKPEEKARLEELKKAKKLRNDAISILRGISIRMPLLIYGANIPYDEEITLDRFIEVVDDSSWNEFMPNGVSKEKFKEFQKYYDEEVFIAAGRRIRNIAKSADELEPIDRVQKIASLFSYFKNPDKETVLTPWRVVNMHMSDCLGGYDFWNESHNEVLPEPRFVDKGKTTNETFGKNDCKILEINSKTGLYPLYVTYSIYCIKCEKLDKEKLTLDRKKELWLETVKSNIFVVCKTPMAKAITQRTLMGYSEEKINAHYFNDLLNIMRNKPQQFIDKVQKGSYWKRKEKTMKFDAIVGNPPYMEMDGGAQASAKPIYQYFVNSSKKINTEYISFIIPTRWYTGGKGLDEFREQMLNDVHICELHDCLNPAEIFPNTNIRGGVCYFMWNKNYNNVKDLTEVITHYGNNSRFSIKRNLKIEGSDIFVRDGRSLTILEKVRSLKFESISEYISPRKPFGLEGNFIKTDKFVESKNCLKKPVKCYGKAKTVGYTEKLEIHSHREWIDCWKVYMPYANNIGTELNDDNQNSFVGEPNSVCTETFLLVGYNLDLDIEKARNLSLYLKTKFARFLLSLAKTSQHATSKTYIFVPLQDFSKKWTDEDLFKKYNFTEEEIEFINQTIKSMD